MPLKHRIATLSLLIFCLLATALPAQTGIALDVRPGLTHLNSFGTANFGSRAGFSIHQRISDRWEIAGGPGYTFIRDKELTNRSFSGFDNIDVAVLNQFHFIDFELEAGFRICERLRIAAGPWLARMVRAWEITYPQNQLDQLESWPVENYNWYERLRKFDFGLQTSLSCQLTEEINLGLGYRQGLRFLHLPDDQDARSFFRTSATTLNLAWMLWQTKG